MRNKYDYFTAKTRDFSKKKDFHKRINFGSDVNQPKMRNDVKHQNRKLDASETELKCF